jgi:hypothetical protein
MPKNKGWKMKWTDKKIVNWHKKTFPDCTLESQLAKLDEELKEVVDAQRSGEKEKSYDELADVYIVSTVLKERFDSTIGKYFIGLLNENPAPESLKRVDRKMNVNSKRTWTKVNGVYRHKED